MNFLLALLNFKSIGKFVGNNWKTLLILVVSGGIYFKYQDLTGQIEDYADKLKEKAEDLIACSAMKDELRDELRLQNKRIQSLVEQGEEAEKRLDEARDNNRDLQNRLEDELNSIDEERIPESCEGTMEWMLDKAQNK